MLQKAPVLQVERLVKAATPLTPESKTRPQTVLCQNDVSTLHNDTNMDTLTWESMEVDSHPESPSSGH